MRLMIAFLIQILPVADALGSTMSIIIDNLPGEIYVVGPIAHRWGMPALYYSSDYGETLELRDTASTQYSEYCELLADKADSTLYKILWQGDPVSGQYVSMNGGSNWNIVDTLEFINKYASGVISGEVYRRMDDPPWYSVLERSENHGNSYEPCTCNGYPHNLTVYNTALGIDTGEVYIWGMGGNLYYSQDYGENFTLLGDLYTTFGVSPWTEMVNGSMLGEVFIHHQDSQRIWRVFDFGASVLLIANFTNPYISWYCGLTAGHQPGELYFRAFDPHWNLGGTLHILHTTDYFQSWQLYEHIIRPSGIKDGKNNIVPSTISMEIYPNPANAGFNISYYLNTVQDVKLDMHNILGRNVWRSHVGVQAPGNYRISIDNRQLSSGMYFLRLRSGKDWINRTVQIIK